ncbi:putative Gluconolactonase [Hyphomicrobiales bacterium]|nr:putative Gluconolactonase [Hyphomicrobiales bacterium]
MIETNNGWRPMTHDLHPNDITVVTSGLTFPEGPVWCDDGSVAVVEMVGQRVTRIDADGRKTLVGKTAGGPNGMALGPNGDFFICNNGGVKWYEQDGAIHLNGVPDGYNGGWIERMDPRTGAVTNLYKGCGEHRLNSPNDIVFDRNGGFYFTDLGRNHPRYRDHGAIYYAWPDGSFIREVAYPLLTPNGIGLSPDERVLYVAETETCRLWSFDLAEPGAASADNARAPHGGRVLCGLPGYQKFDSLAVDADGNIHVATLLSGAITVITPHGAVVETVLFDDPFTTNICFGDDDRKTQFVTLSSRGLLAKRRVTTRGLALKFSGVVGGDIAVG